MPESASKGSIARAAERLRAFSRALAGFAGGDGFVFTFGDGFIGGDGFILALSVSPVRMVSFPSAVTVSTAVTVSFSLCVFLFWW